MTKEVVEHVAQLARLKLETEEIDSIRKQLSVVLENFEQIEGVETQGVEPLVTPTEISMTLREDRSEECSVSDEIIAVAPEKSGRTYKVPPVV